MDTDYIVGLDLGQTQDFTALAVLERSGPLEEPDLAVRHLHRYPLATAYTAIVPAVVRLTNTPPLAGNCMLVVDQTGVGRPLVELLLKEPGVPRVVPVTITGGHEVTMLPDRSFHVPKKELVTALQLLLQGRRLRVAASLPDAELLMRELSNFQVKITEAANETFGAWREGVHDDLVLAVALACWLAGREPRWGPDACSTGGESLVAKMMEHLGERW
jgi:hypothetical protein